MEIKDVLRKSPSKR